MKDGRTHLAHKAEHGVDLETGAILLGDGAGCVGGRFGDAAGGVLRRRHYMGTVGVFAATEAVVFNAVAGELVERPFAHQYEETGGLRRVWVRGHETVRSLAGAGSVGHLRTGSPDRALGASDGLLGLPMDAGGAGRLNRSSPSCLNRPAQRTAFFHGLLASEN